ncbi:heparan-alpha-glucosaminide N-acetyltransferase [Kaistia dalseonensis]|uniref:Membrane protein n=1 Tax=Kaistia dalseonensis TaxID=410840 RepID=A0ABU0H799_9HYPH|nr:heparan-alpha-glucosaminide N-acetyltransferase [Kaistia dalseonensis]MCX5495083.1 heparan-alpha-glucosaminide N-acetyltransferase [Kaistia dalseonensis]MDQ0437665.1 putative membrane protein [Kaistia dalseonensis]
MIEASAPRRIALIDVIRGGALIAMMIFHGAWDVSYFRIIRFDPGASIGWIIFARAIAGTFLALVGVSLVLSTRNGFKLHAYLRRLAMVAGAAALVSIATYFVLPQGWVFFGILHQILIASVLALPFLRLPPLVTLVSAAFIFVVPFAFRHPIFAFPALWWVGLAPESPPSFDYVPVFPWFGVVLAGLALGRFGVDQGWDRRLARWTPRFAIGRLLDFGGRHSLAVYLIHQPVLYAFFFAVAHLFMPNAAEDAARADCADRCVVLGNSAEGCQSYCACVFDGLKASKLLAPLLDGSMTPEQTDRLRETAGLCTAKTLPAVPPARTNGDEPAETN